MQITLNGKPYTLEQPVNLTRLSELLKLEAAQVAIELNREIIPRSQYKETTIDEGDKIEIVTFIGGG
jgi:thiamine biosynthesis protein ThiS